jgi:uncharacterized membrane protein YbhN (UPF0104 family)
MLWLGFHAVATAPGLGVLLVFQIFVKLANQVAITPGNLGLTELAYGLLAQATNATLEQGLAVGILLRAVGTIAVVGLGLICGGGPWLVGQRRHLAQTGSAGGASVEFSATKK